MSRLNSILRPFETRTQKVSAARINADNILTIAEAFQYPLNSNNTAVSVATPTGIVPGTYGTWFVSHPSGKHEVLDDVAFANQYQEPQTGEGQTDESVDDILDAEVTLEDTADSGYVHQIITVESGGTYVVNNYYAEPEKESE